MSPCDKGFKSTIFLNPIISDAHIKKNKYYWQQMATVATVFINIYKCTYVKTANEMKCIK